MSEVDHRYWSSFREPRSLIFFSSADSNLLPLCVCERERERERQTERDIDARDRETERELFNHERERRVQDTVFSQSLIRHEAPVRY
jgi:hypothetical protein